MVPMLKTMLPDFERLVPTQIGAFKNRITELDNLNTMSQGPWYKYQELTQSGTAQALLEASKTAPPEMTPYLVAQAAWKAMSAGDDETAKQIIEKIGDPFQRNEMKQQLLRQNLSKAREQSKLADARALISQMPSIEERATLLAQLAESYKENGEKATALQLLGEAEALLGLRAQSYAQLQARVLIAQTYNSLEPDTGTATIERVIQQVNELVSAVVVLNGFDVQGYFRNGEFILNNGNPLNTVATECGRTLAAGAAKNTDRARLVAEQIERPEIRLVALVQIAESLIAAEPQLAAATRVEH
jgi:DNA primase